MKELEERGIGRPSTYASVIETIQARDYVWKKGTALVPTWTAFAKVQLLERHFAHLVDYEFTATMEEALDDIARGEGEAEKWLHSLLLRQRPGRAARARVRRAPRADRHGRGQHDPDRHRRRRATRSSCACGRTARNIERGDETAPIPVDLAPDELTLEKADELLAKRGRRPARARHRPRHRAHRARAHRPLRPVRAARRAGAGLEGEAEARASLFASMDARHASRSTRRCSCCRCRASSASTPTARRSPRRTAATART